MVWPSAARAFELLNGVSLGIDPATTAPLHSPDRHKRQADDAFGQEKHSDFLQREAFGAYEPGTAAVESDNGVQEMSTRIMAQMLGLEIPGIEASTSYYPGYEWWPRPNHETTAPHSSYHTLAPLGSLPTGIVDVPTPGTSIAPHTRMSGDEWPQQILPPEHTSSSYPYTNYNYGV